jgi:alginate O-acetyltransferase complex protein AlgI
MLFNSTEYIFLFLPVTLFIYYILTKNKLIVASKILLIFSSLFFYGYWNINYIPLLLLSIMVNYCFGSALIKKPNKSIAIIAILFNISLLAYFKYANFFIENIRFFSPNGEFSSINIVLPLAISFFTFQQIAYIVDCYSKQLRDQDFLNYVIFITFFPQLIAGPIVHHKEMMPQFHCLRSKVINYKNIATGIFIFSVGLFKKVIIADYLAQTANISFDNYILLSSVGAWKASLAYTFQLYFDFSGYTDMAIGSALMFNIMLPFNFNQPYKACNIKDFWNRWHMTLSLFLRDYIYIPLGGNRVSNFKIYTNLMIVFLISGLWHGAGWTFIFWGILHGSAICINRFWGKCGMKMSKGLGWFITFNFINISWIFFRSENFNQAVTILQKMFFIDVNKIGFIENYEQFMEFIRFKSIEYIALVLAIFILYFIFPIIIKDAEQLKKKFEAKKKYVFISTILLVLPILSYHKTSEFLYFNF